MALQREPGEHKDVTHCRPDLDQVRSAVRWLRASSPRSALADLAEAKLRAIEKRVDGPRPGGPRAGAGQTLRPSWDEPRTP